MIGSGIYKEALVASIKQAGRIRRGQAKPARVTEFKPAQVKKPLPAGSSSMIGCQSGVMAYRPRMRRDGLSAEEEQFIESMGLFFERQGVPVRVRERVRPQPYDRQRLVAAEVLRRPARRQQQLRTHDHFRGRPAGRDPLRAVASGRKLPAVGVRPRGIR